MTERDAPAARTPIAPIEGIPMTARHADGSVPY